MNYFSEAIKKGQLDRDRNVGRATIEEILRRVASVPTCCVIEKRIKRAIIDKIRAMKKEGKPQ